MNINSKSLYGDLDGLARSIKMVIQSERSFMSDNIKNGTISTYLNFPRWNLESKEESIKQIYEWVVAHAAQNADWYNKRRGKMKNGAQVIRAAAIGGGAIGGLCPLLASAIGKNLAVGCVTIDFSTWGYVFIAFAGAVLTTDKYYGFSKAWMRYAKTQLELQTALSDFYLEWAGIECSNVELCKRIETLKLFAQKVEALIHKETDMWSVEFNNSIAALESLLKSGGDKTPAVKPQ
jgi:hypothetical protein